MKNSLVLACVLLLVVGTLFAQSKKTDEPKPQAGNAVEVEKDRFSGDVTIRLNPQKVLDTPAHIISLTIETKFFRKSGSMPDAVSRTLGRSQDNARLAFESQSKGLADFADRQLNFIADGKRINCGYSDKVPLPRIEKDPSLLPGFSFREMYVSSLPIEDLIYISNCKSVEMKLGSYEMNLTPELLGKLREFVVEHRKQSLPSKGSQ
jgi:hypothetical protein